MSVLIETMSPLGNLVMEEELDYCDGPLVFIAKNQLGHRFVVSAVQRVSGLLSWLVVPVSERREKSLLFGGISLRNTFLQSETGMVYFVETPPISGKRSSVIEIVCSNTSEDYLPAENYSLAGVWEHIFQNRSFEVHFEKFAPRKDVRIRFERRGRRVSCTFIPKPLPVLAGVAICHPDDKFDWETGMRLSFKRLIDGLAKDRRKYGCGAGIDDSEAELLQRSFRRWIFLSKLTYNCQVDNDCWECPKDKRVSCRIALMNFRPGYVFDSEFGQVQTTIIFH